ncbi:hypothetical protein PB01_15530 [Psychrobacillus glaciei]|uniref:DUF3796 domain-containing protein n=1 Tax=Psychrobacillus glaciei TaxID=2283160 RepID=A0A5J6SRK8_9BACI|nr:hypothetical protein [Psychrobacillus glaciei]QFG00124.1 hypothetical protein PB01_15530 [Psychrobacillus glaciei]
MFEDFDLLTLFLGLPLGIITMMIVFFIMRKFGKKKRWFDERYTKMNEKARSISWIFTTFAILIAWMIITVIEGPGLSFFIMTGIWLIHMVSYSIGAIVSNQGN